MNHYTTLFENINIETKKCNQCKSEKPLSAFAKTGTYLRSKCRDCEKSQSRQRNSFRNLSPPVNHICPICKRSEEDCTGEGGKKAGTWCCDHNHDTGEFRGWLCHSCNRALGNFKDRTDLLENALQYLKP